MTVVAIDGPAGSGKSTVAAALALRLGVPHVDTGAIYRAATLAVLRAGVDVRDEAACLRVVERASILRADGRTRLDGEDVEALIRGPEVTAAVSAVSEHPAVRAALLGLQRAQVGDAGGVVEGRDAGTVVVPDARLKVWLTANPLERARRRDAHDAAQMRRAPDAVEIDTTGRGIEDLVDELASMVEARA